MRRQQGKWGRAGQARVRLPSAEMQASLPNAWRVGGTEEGSGSDPGRSRSQMRVAVPAEPGAPCPHQEVIYKRGFSA